MPTSSLRRRLAITTAWAAGLLELLALLRATLVTSRKERLRHDW